MTEVRERVERGAALLDQNTPGWELLIDLHDLHMEDCDSCILGQVYGAYVDGLDVLKVRSGWRVGPDDEDVLLGFEIDGLAYDVSYRTLGEAWKDLIKERLDAGIVL